MTNAIDEEDRRRDSAPVADVRTVVIVVLAFALSFGAGVTATVVVAPAVGVGLGVLAGVCSAGAAAVVLIQALNQLIR